MITYFSKIMQLDNLTYNIENTNLVLLPLNTKNSIDYKVTVRLKLINGDTVQQLDLSCIPYFFNSRTGGKYKIDLSNIEWDNLDLNINLKIWEETYENSDSDYLVLDFITVDDDRFSCRLPIRTKVVNRVNRVFDYIVGSTIIRDSNMLTPFNRVGFPLWGTIHKNITSVSQKILDSLHSNILNTYNKNSEYLKQTFNLDYIAPKFSRVYLKGYPKSIYRIYPNNINIELKETEDIYSSINFLSLEPHHGESLELHNFIYSPEHINTDFYEILTNVIKSTNNSILYFKNLRSNSDPFISCIIRGINDKDVEISETIILRYDMYSKIQNKFKTIIEVDCKYPIEISNYVDLRYSHYINLQPYILPSLMDTQYRIFKPEIKVKSNHELTNNIIVLNNNLYSDGTEVYKFAIDGSIKSFYIDDKLNILYLMSTEDSEDGLYLNTSKLNLDYTKKIGNHTVNNNSYIEITDINTAVGDWVDVSIYIDRYITSYKSKSFFIEVRNNGVLFYYDPDLNILVSEKKFIYTEQLSTDILEFTLFIENSNPYIINLIDETKGTCFSSMTEIPEIKPYTSKNVSNDLSDYLILYKDEVKLISSSYNEDIYFTEDDNIIRIIFKNDYYDDFNFYIKINDDFISNSETSLTEGFYNKFDCKSKGLFILEFDKRLLQSRYGNLILLGIGSSYDITNGIIDEDLVLSTVKIQTDVVIKEEILNPKLNIGSKINQVEYNFSIDLLDVSNLTSERNIEYDS